MPELMDPVLGRVGAFLPVSFTTTPPIDEQRAAVRRLEEAGCHAAWTNEVIGKDALVQAGLLLAAARVGEYLAAGADHVMVKATDEAYREGIDRLVALAPALLG